TTPFLSSSIPLVIPCNVNIEPVIPPVHSFITEATQKCFDEFLLSKFSPDI
ncbi:hypothetical protein RUM43_012462, partial [Polyplax serrata]